MIAPPPPPPSHPRRRTFLLLALPPLLAAALTLAGLGLSLARNPAPELAGPLKLAPATGARLGAPLRVEWTVRLPWHRWPRRPLVWSGLPEHLQVVSASRRPVRIGWLTWDWRLRAVLQPLQAGAVAGVTAEVQPSPGGRAGERPLAVLLPAFSISEGPAPASGEPAMAGPRAAGFWRRLAWWQWLAAGLGAALLAWALLSLFLWRRGRPAAALPPALPWELAAAELERLAAGEPHPGRFFLRLTDIIRHYCEWRYGLRAAEMTTPEFIRHLSRNPVLPEPQQARLAGLLEQADAVKFAQGQATPAQMREALEHARRFVHETVPAEPPD
ncbi:MAG: hypothetical protein WC789_07365 [Lentisphaeria bacterium]|jgi:hypothetical protein